MKHETVLIEMKEGKKNNCRELCNAYEHIKIRFSFIYLWIANFM